MAVASATTTARSGIPSVTPTAVIVAALAICSWSRWTTPSASTAHPSGGEADVGGSGCRCPSQYPNAATTPSPVTTATTRRAPTEGILATVFHCPVWRASLPQRRDPLLGVGGAEELGRYARQFTQFVAHVR